MIRERIAEAMEVSRKQELLALNAEIEDLVNRIKRLEHNLIEKKSTRNYLTKSINDGVTDDQIADVLTGVMVGQGVVSDADPEWMEDSDLETDA